MGISRLTKAAKAILARQAAAATEEAKIPEIFDAEGKIDYQLIQKDILFHHYKALANCVSMELQCFKAGDIDGAAKMAASTKIHTDAIARITGIDYYANINTAVKRLESDGYIVRMPEELEVESTAFKDQP